jgi:hypothetical protein
MKLDKFTCENCGGEFWDYLHEDDWSNCECEVEADSNAIACEKVCSVCETW